MHSNLQPWVSTEIVSLHHGLPATWFKFVETSQNDCGTDVIPSGIPQNSTLDCKTGLSPKFPFTVDKWRTSI